MFWNKKKVQEEVIVVGSDEDPVFNSHSGTWKYLEKDIKALIESYRDDLEKPRFEAVKTAEIRGMIAVLRRVLDVPNTPLMSRNARPE